MPRSYGRLLSIALLLLGGCATPADPEGDPDASGVSDAGGADGGLADAGPADAGGDDAGTSDGGGDAGSADAGSSDAGSSDAGSSDAGSSDAGSTPCTSHSNADACTTASCAWHAEACATPTVLQAGCHDPEFCTDGSCAEGETCRWLYAHPCADGDCRACAAPVRICLPSSDDPCAGAHRGEEGRCVDGNDSPVPAACCGSAVCDDSRVTCREATPSCSQGEVPSVVGDCWGPCVPASDCLNPDRAHCGLSAGTWEPDACGHAICGRGNDCDAIIPGCNCGPGASFLEGTCASDSTCRAELGEACNGRTLHPVSCGDGLVCFHEPDAPADAPGECRLEANNLCEAHSECPTGSLCCYPCGMPGCDNRCMLPLDGACPLFP